MADPTLRRPTYFILASLLDEPLHGYGIIKRVDALTSGGLRLRAGTLYAALDRLSEQGLVTVDREEVVASRLRRYYRLTPEGGTTVTAEAERLREAAEVVLSVAMSPARPRTA